MSLFCTTMVPPRDLMNSSSSWNEKHAQLSTARFCSECCTPQSGEENSADLYTQTEHRVPLGGSQDAPSQLQMCCPSCDPGSPFWVLLTFSPPAPQTDALFLCLTRCLNPRWADVDRSSVHFVFKEGEQEEVSLQAPALYLWVRPHSHAQCSPLCVD